MTPLSEVDAAWVEAWYRDGYSVRQLAKAFHRKSQNLGPWLRSRGVIVVRARRRRLFRQRKDGYIAKGKMLAHRLIAAATLGRPLRAGEIVHHRNHVRHDNRPENLEVLSSGREHMVRYHCRHDPWTPEMEAQLIAFYATHTAIACAVEFGTSVHAVRGRIVKLQHRGRLSFKQPRQPVRGA